MATAATDSTTEARRRRLLARGQERLNRIASGSKQDGVSRSLDFNGQEPAVRQASLTPAASGLLPGENYQEGAAQRSKSWLARQESPPPSRKSSPDQPSALRPGSAPFGDDNIASPLAPAHSASLAPVSSPAGNYASDEEAGSMPSSPMVTRSSASSGTVLTGVLPSAACSPQPLPLAPSVNGTQAASPEPSHSSFQAKHGSQGGAATEIPPAASAHSPRRQRVHGLAAFQQALSATAPARTLLSAACAAFSYAGGPEAVATGWQQHLGQPPPGAALLQHVPPLAAALAVQLLVVLLTCLLRSPVQQQSVVTQSLLGGLWGMATAASPQLHSTFSVIWALYQHLWQDVAVYIFTVALCTEAGAPRYHGHWRHLHSLVHHHVSQMSPGWRVAAGRWTL